MAFFKFRKDADEAPSAPTPPPSVEVIRQRAKYRLVGASVLVLAGVILFPLLLDSQPRSVAVNTPIEIPDKNKMPPLQIPAAPAPAAAVPVATPAQVVAAADNNANRPAANVNSPAAAIITEAAAPANAVNSLEKNKAPALAGSAQVAIKNGTAEVSRPANVGPTASSTAAKPVLAAPAALSPASDAARATALLEGGSSKAVQATSASSQSSPAGAAQRKASSTVAVASDAQPAPDRFVVQVGAFADAVRAREVRLKVEHAGLKTYTHVADTKDGRRIRVRVGPYTTRDEAEKAAAKIRKLDLPAALLTL